MWGHCLQVLAQVLTWRYSMALLSWFNPKLLPNCSSWLILFSFLLLCKLYENLFKCCLGEAVIFNFKLSFAWIDKQHDYCKGLIGYFSQFSSCWKALAREVTDDCKMDQERRSENDSKFSAPGNIWEIFASRLSQSEGTIVFHFISNMYPAPNLFFKCCVEPRHLHKTNEKCFNLLKFIP